MIERGRVYARLGGAMYLVIFMAALFGEVFVSGALIVDGDAAATAARIVGSEQLWRFAVGAQAVTLVCDATVAWLLYVLLKAAGKNIALLAAYFRLTYVAIYAPAVLANIMALRLAKAGHDEAVMLALHFHDMAFFLSLLFFGLHIVLIGYLIGRAPFSVRWLAIALEIAGICYVANTAAALVAPSLNAIVNPWIMLPPFCAELALAFWLLFAAPGAGKNCRSV